MAGSWGGQTTTPEELWSSLFTVVHASWDDLRPLMERFDLDDLVAFRRGLQSAIEDQVERQFVEAEEAAAQESSAAAAGPSGDTPGVASGSGSADPQVEVAPAAQARLGAPAAKDPTTGPPPTMGTPKEMSVQAKAFVKADPPPFIPPISKTKGKGKGKDGGPPVATPTPKASPPPGKQVAVKATPDQVRALFAGEMQPQTAEDAIGLLRATDAATRPQAHQVAIVDLDTMDDDLDDDPPLPPPPGLPPSSPSPPSKPMPSAVDQTPKAKTSCSGPRHPARRWFAVARGDAGGSELQFVGGCRVEVAEKSFGTKAGRRLPGLAGRTSATELSSVKHSGQ